MVNSRENDPQNCGNMVHTLFVLEVHIGRQLRAQRGGPLLWKQTESLPTLP